MGDNEPTGSFNTEATDATEATQLSTEATQLSTEAASTDAESVGAASAESGRESSSKDTEEASARAPASLLIQSNYLDGESHSPVYHARRKSNFYVDSTLNSLNFGLLSNRCELEMKKTYTRKKIKIQQVFRVGLFLMTGALVALIGVFLELATELLLRLKLRHYKEFAPQEFGGTFEEFLLFVMYRLINEVPPILVGSAIVVFIAPWAAGGGVPQSIAYLNGVDVPNVLNMTGLFAKVLSTACMVISGLGGGRGGPMMHMGTITGGNLPSAFPCMETKLEKERRDLAAAGFGCVIACVFGSPIGGLLWALEEGDIFLKLSIMWKIYVCCVFGFALGAIAMSLIRDVKLTNTDLLIMGYIDPEITDYSVFEILPFSVMAVIGGLVGAFFTRTHVEVAKYRNIYMKTKTRKMIASFLAALMVVFFQVTSIWFVRPCSPHPHLQHHKNESCLHRLYCPEGEHSDMSVLLAMTEPRVLRILFGRQMLKTSSLGMYFVIYFILVTITMNVPISSGIFIPQFVMGAAWGRLFGMILKETFNNAAWATPAKYAYLGAAAQVSGTTGKTFSVIIIFVEASGCFYLSLPLIVIATIARAICTSFVLPIYETQMRIAGLPFLPSESPPVSSDVPTAAVMSRPPLVTLPPSPSVEAIIRTLRDNKHNGFPVVARGRNLLEGLMLRQQLLILLKYRAYLQPTPSTVEEMCDSHRTYMTESRTKLDETKIFASVAAEDYAKKIDLTPHYNIHPKTVLHDMPMVKTYNVFRTLGVRHIVVITKHYEPVGMITRKDLAKFDTVKGFCSAEVKEMPIK